MEGETTGGQNDSGRNDSGRTGKLAKRPVTFQDIDPTGKDVLRPDSIATALIIAIELTESRMDPNR